MLAFIIIIKNSPKMKFEGSREAETKLTFFFKVDWKELSTQHIFHFFKAKIKLPCMIPNILY